MSTGHSLDIAERLRSGGTWRGTLPLAAFERFAATVAGGGHVAVSVRFLPDDRARARVTGACGVHAQVVCARCGSDVDVLVECAVDFRLVASEAQAQALMPALETVVETEDRVSVAALVEDDLLLSLPEAGCEDRDRCSNWAERPDVATAEPAPRESPFAVLGNFKTRERNNQTEEAMAVQQNKVTRSKRDKRRSHHALAAPTLAEDETTGETHRRHHVTEDGFYRGRKVLETRR